MTAPSEIRRCNIITFIEREVTMISTGRLCRWAPFNSDDPGDLPTSTAMYIAEAAAECELMTCRCRTTLAYPSGKGSWTVSILPVKAAC